MWISIEEFGSWIGKKGNRLIVRKGREVIHEVSLEHVDGISVGRGIALSSDLILLVVKRGIPLFFSSNSSRPTFVFSSFSLELPEVRERQITISNFQRKYLTKEIIYSKIFNQKSCLKKMGFEDIDLFLENHPDPLVFEAKAAKKYWSHFRNLSSYFKGREPRGTDFVNSALNYGYGILRLHLLKAILSVGLDPYFGIFHRRENYKMSFLFDFMEPFRPLIDFTVFSWLLKLDEVGDFEKEKISLADKVISLFKTPFRWSNQTTSLSRIFVLQCYEFVNFLLGKKKSIYIFRWLV